MPALNWPSGEVPTPANPAYDDYQPYNDKQLKALRMRLKHGMDAGGDMQLEDNGDDAEDAADGEAEEPDATLYQFTSKRGFDPLSMFDSDDLDAGGVFVLQVERPQGTALHVWVGSDYDISEHFSNDLALFDFVKKEFVAKVKPSNVSIAKFQRGGDESEDFWDAFTNG